MRQLEVYVNDVKAGLLIEKTPGMDYSFQYFDEYLASSMPPISVNLPKRKEAFSSQYLFPLFANIIPEGGNRRIICRNLRIDEEDLFGLLCAMADQDFIGAVNVRSL